MKFSVSNALMTIASAGLASATTGRMTYFDLGLGACGWTNTDSQLAIAAPAGLWTAANPNNDPLCGMQVAITYGGKTVYAEVVDKCPTSSCTVNDIDVSPAVFEQFAAETIGVLEVDWEFVNCPCYPNCGCTGGDACYCNYAFAADAPCAPNCGCLNGAVAVCSKPN
ncbi:RlpA-like double-psi beta-barrel-protein domain-containing protein-containing protein [Xylariales sp. PMI_506]|nr:RlpA-like double-psi beta-barrel-protein domain-containing protein-containing protein [Xylariales sp. PMI_506]